LGPALVLVIVPITVTKIPDINSLGEERFILAHSVIGFSPWLLDPMLFVLGQNIMAMGVCSGSWFLLCGQQEVQVEVFKDTPLPLTTPHLLQFSQPPKTAPPARDQKLKTGGRGGRFISKP
jgi:hypothetical protein